MQATQKLCEISNKLNVYYIAGFVLCNPKFSIWSGSSKPYSHHYGKGGLAQHTLEVCELCLLNNQYFDSTKSVDSSKLFLAALFHDVGKIWDYDHLDTEYKEWKSNKHKDNVGHIVKSASIWNEAAKQCSWEQEDSDDVLHCILAHHGHKEWGSPVNPQTRMAWLLHLCDGISARLDDCYTRKAFSKETK